MTVLPYPIAGTRSFVLEWGQRLWGRWVGALTETPVAVPDDGWTARRRRRFR